MDYMNLYQWFEIVDEAAKKEVEPKCSYCGGQCSPMTGLKKMILDAQTGDGITWCSECERTHVDLVFYQDKLKKQRFLLTDVATMEEEKIYLKIKENET